MMPQPELDLLRICRLANQAKSSAGYMLKAGLIASDKLDFSDECSTIYDIDLILVSNPVPGQKNMTHINKQLHQIDSLLRSDLNDNTNLSLVDVIKISIINLLFQRM